MAADPDGVVVLDAGRVEPGSPAVTLLRGASAVLVLTRPRVEDLSHVASVLPVVPTWTRCPGLVLVGGGYSPAEVEGELGVPAMADPRGADVLCGRPGGRSVHRSALGQAAAGTLPRVLRRDPDATRRLAWIEAITAWTEMLRDTLSAAAGLHQAILATAPTAPQAIHGEITELVVRIERGEPLPGALRALADDLADPTADLVLAALILACEHPTRQLAALLVELTTEAREQVFLRLRIEAGRSRIRTSVWVIVATTVVFTAGLLVASRGHRSCGASTAPVCSLPRL